MNPILKKLKLAQQNPVLIMNAPEEYSTVINDIECEVHTEIKGKYEFIQVFVKSLTEANSIAETLIETLQGDGYLWICYPKGASKKYKSDVKRDNLVEVFAPFNFEPVTMIAVDEDWSAMRFKDVDNIKNMKRKSAFSEKGKERIKESTER